MAMNSFVFAIKHCNMRQNSSMMVCDLSVQHVCIYQYIHSTTYIIYSTDNFSSWILVNKPFW